ncbi:hypothetical protein B566_EDAN009671 [Ephemera danica]|nr:hypothetical protein B566_EDAN009671 [Ephemera danica]
MALFMRITRALLLKGYSKFEDWMTKIIEFLVTPSLSSIAAGSFHLLVTEENSYLSTEKHATVRFLYKQRLSEYLPQLEVAHRSSEPSTKPNLLLAITHLVHIAPRQVLSPSLPQLELPMVAVQAALACLQPLLQECSTHLESHLSDLTKPCIQLATQHPSMKVRIAALQCMALVPHYKLTNQLVAMKLDVLDGLRPALDDHKRLVRAAAVKACNHWHMVGALPDT